MKGVAAMRATVIAFGRFTGRRLWAVGAWLSPSRQDEQDERDESETASCTSCSSRQTTEHQALILRRQRLQHQLAHRLEGVEDALAAHRDRLEVGRPLDPLAARKLLDQLLAGVVRVGGDALARRLGDLPAGIERRLELAH